jgi:hypothetical protein
MARIAAIVLTTLTVLAAAGGVQAQERDFCADRPGKGSPPCVLDAGRLQAELAGVDASFSRGGGTSVDDVTYGALELRLGLSATVEGQMTWTAHERVRTKDRASGIVDTVSGDGDLGLALRWSLRHPAGDGVSLALEPFVTAPTDAHGVGGELWQGGVAVPLSVPLGQDWSLNLSPQVEARENASGTGRHAGYALAAGVGHAIGPVNFDAELWVDRDEDPAGLVTQTSLDLTAAWTPKALHDVQLDASAYVGLNRQTPDLELAVGLAHRF